MSVNVKGIIWCLKLEDGLHKLDEMIEQYERYGCYVVKKFSSRNSPLVIFDNGDIWKVRPAHEAARMERCNISYIQKGISFDFIEDVIMHCMYGPYTAYRIWSR